MNISFEVGDMFKLVCLDGDALCMITDVLVTSPNPNIMRYKVFWFVQKGNVKNTLAYQQWTKQAMHTEFIKLA